MATFTYLNDLWGDNTQGPGGNLGSVESSDQLKRRGYNVQESQPQVQTPSKYQENTPSNNNQNSYRGLHSLDSMEGFPPANHRPPMASAMHSAQINQFQSQLQGLQEVIEHMSSELKETKTQLQTQKNKPKTCDIFVLILVVLFILVVFLLLKISKSLATLSPIRQLKPPYLPPPPPPTLPSFSVAPPS